MTSIKTWIGNEVSVTLHSTVPTTFNGILLAVDAKGVFLDYEGSSVFLPMTSILHLTQLGKPGN